MPKEHEMDMVTIGAFSESCVPSISWRRAPIEHMHFLGPGHTVVLTCYIGPVSSMSFSAVKTVNRAVGHSEKLRIGTVGIRKAGRIVLPIIITQRF